jgi:hypothetical protein
VYEREEKFGWRAADVNISAALCALVCAPYDWKCPSALSVLPSRLFYYPSQ